MTTLMDAFRNFTSAPTRFLLASYCQISEHTFPNWATVKAVLTFVVPSIVIYFYSKTNQMHKISN